MTDFQVRRMKPAWPRFMTRTGKIVCRSFKDSTTNACELFGLRLIYFEARSVLTQDLRLDLDRALSDRLVDDGAGGFTLEQALRATDELLSDDAPDVGGLLADYRTYLVERMTRVTDFRAKQFAI